MTRMHSQLTAAAQGNSIRSASIAPLDILTLLLGIGVATADLMTGHRNHTLNNSLACLIVVDILQVIPSSPNSLLCCMCMASAAST